jgi:hypothetical protein
MTMPRNVDDILKHADDLARRFEEYVPRPGDKRPGPAEQGLLDAIAAQARAERQLIEAVREARRSGMPWASIGTAVGTSGEAARQRYGRLCA